MRDLAMPGVPFEPTPHSGLPSDSGPSSGRHADAEARRSVLTALLCANLVM